MPLGDLIPENQGNKSNVQKQIPKKSFVISVGDRTTDNMVAFGLIPSLQIIDNQEKRIKREPLKNNNTYTELVCNNPAAEITPQSVDAIKKAFVSKTPVRLTVVGEEDLLVIPVCIYAPENSLVMYGQPNEGLVIVKITPEIRNKTQRLLDLME
ncbi:MAG: GTP-dependent dephospho-CoA kinase family protein [Nitrosarchaeum sp.]|nr:GTP-dependent dephospho-CoA kinase family protein [Nitrosarchaeum sp.]